jgi:hypothetical protein
MAIYRLRRLRRWCAPAVVGPANRRRIRLFNDHPISARRLRGTTTPPIGMYDQQYMDLKSPEIRKAQLALSLAVSLARYNASTPRRGASTSPTHARPDPTLIINATIAELKMNAITPWERLMIRMLREDVTTSAVCVAQPITNE